MSGVQGPPVFMKVSNGHFVDSLNFVSHLTLRVGRKFLEDELFREVVEAETGR